MYASKSAMQIVAVMVLRQIRLVVQKAKKLSGDQQLVVSDRRRKSINQVIALHQRFERGDYTITAKEWGTVCSVGSWLLELHAANNNHPRPNFDWNSISSFYQTEPAPDGWYAVATTRVVQGIV